jgi:NAD(P)H dehydrogenase (quinone)
VIVIPKMPKILVVYDSKSGNTETMALAVAKGAEKAGDLEVTVKRAEQTTNSDLLAADGIIMGSPTYFGQMSAKLKALIDESIQVHKQLTGKVGGAFTSSGGTASGGETTLLSIVQAMLIHGMIVQGRADDKHYGVAVTGAPKKKDLAECEKLGERVGSLVLKLNSS